MARKHRRFTVYFTPTPASWLNMVERFSAEIFCLILNIGANWKDASREKRTIVRRNTEPQMND